MFKFLHAFFVSLGAIGIFAYLGFVIAFIIGYFMNVYWLIMFALGGAADATFTNMFMVQLAARVIGLFFGPLGAAMGLFA